MKTGNDLMEESAETTRVIPSLKPIWRSVGFWLGLFVMVSLVWAGLNSLYRRTWIEYVSVGKVYGAGMDEMSLQVRRVEADTTRLWGKSQGWNIDRFAMSITRDLKLNRVSIFGRWCWFEVVEDEGSTVTTYFSLPFWFVCASWLILWIGVLFRRRRPKCNHLNLGRVTQAEKKR